MPISILYRQVAKVYFFFSGNGIDLLYHCQSFGLKLSDLPSWIPDWSMGQEDKESKLSNILLVNGRYNRRTFTVTLDSKAEIQILKDDLMLEIRGLYYDSIKIQGPKLYRGENRPSGLYKSHIWWYIV